VSFRQVPVIPTIIVLAAVATMIALGLWQLGRAQEKEALLARYDQAIGSSSEVRFPLTGDGEEDLFRRSRLDCRQVLRIEGKAGTSEAGAKGWAQYATCAISPDASIDIVLGWSREPQAPQWDGGQVSGMIAPGPRLVAIPAQAGLEQIALPDPKDVPNNHLAYAGQWFFFALTALVIYGLAIRKRIKEQA